jgi:formylglycine-generating enzyme required for sulfatase activity
MNSYGSGPGETVPVNEYEGSSTPHGVRQLVGNVWEWTANYHADLEIDGEMHAMAEPIGEIRGGAFDTYLAAQSTCSFRGAQPLISRAENVGFRCVASHELLAIITNE